MLYTLHIIHKLYCCLCTNAFTEISRTCSWQAWGRKEYGAPCNSWGAQTIVNQRCSYNQCHRKIIYQLSHLSSLLCHGWKASCWLPTMPVETPIPSCTPYCMLWSKLTMNSWQDCNGHIFMFISMYKVDFLHSPAINTVIASRNKFFCHLLAYIYFRELVISNTIMYVRISKIYQISGLSLHVGTYVNICSININYCDHK